MRLFSNSFLNEYKILNKAIVGIEFEFFSKLNYINTLEHLNRKLSRNIKGIKQYHPSIKPTEDQWILTPDWSALNMAELITHPMPYSEALIIIPKVLNIIDEIGYTTDRSGIHINISFTDKDISKINIIKSIITVDEKMIYNYFPTREDNIYCKSVKSNIPYKNINYSTVSDKHLTSMMVFDDYSKYFGINYKNIHNGRIEYRYLGGDDYHKKINEIIYLMEYFIVSCYNCINTELTEADSLELKKYLENKMNNYNALSRYENFNLKYPNITLEIDRVNDYEKVVVYYSNIYDKIYDIICNVSEFGECVINYDTESNRLEFVYGDLEVFGYLSNIVFISCNINNGNFSNSEFIESTIKNVNIDSSNIQDTDVYDSKIIMTKTFDNTVLNNCYFAEGLLDSTMKGGVFRSGKLGENAEISAETEIYDELKDDFFKSSVSMDNKIKFKTK